jgi:hypothetical protein
VESRILFLDDSGKPDRSHISQAVVIGGFAVDSERYPVLSRRITGAKGFHYPGRGAPNRWEVKSRDIINPNPWKRAKNRAFVQEVSRILGSVNATVYTVTIIKARMIQNMTLKETMPLQLQAVVEHFDAECRALDRLGIVVMDWSSHDLDQHASHCVASFVATRHLELHPVVYYASSQSHEGIQVADLISAIRRRTAEGDSDMATVNTEFHAVMATQNVGATVAGRPFANGITLF